MKCALLNFMLKLYYIILITWMVKTYLLLWFCNSQQFILINIYYIFNFITPFWHSPAPTDLWPTVLAIRPCGHPLVSLSFVRKLLDVHQVLSILDLWSRISRGQVLAWNPPKSKSLSSVQKKLTQSVQTYGVRKCIVNISISIWCYN